MDQTQPTSSPTGQRPEAQASKHLPWLSIILATFTFLLAGLTGYLTYQNILLKQQIFTLQDQQNQQEMPQAQITPAPTNQYQPQTNFQNLNQPSTQSDDGWTRVNYASLFSYEYPSGWHIAELWQENFVKNGVLLAIDPNPISTAPRGGPLATFQITVLNGNKNPEEIIQSRMDLFNEANFSNIVKETINAEIGTVYYYKGEISEGMGQGSLIEKYFFTFNENPNDLINQQVIEASLELKNDHQLSSMLRHIVLSFKEL